MNRLAKRATTKVDPDKAKLSLIDAAERLMAENGINGISLRKIVSEAGQGNSAALQYHFGTRFDLVWAIIDLRTRPIDQSRRAMLEYAQADPKGMSVSQVARAMVMPLASSAVQNRGKEVYYVRFLARFQSEPALIAQSVKHPNYGGLRECAYILHRIVPEIPKQVMNLRIRLALSAMFLEVAEIEREVCKPGAVPEVEKIEERITNIVDSIAGMLSAPVSETVRQ